MIISKCKGFSLIELIVTVAMGSILMSIGIPSLLYTVNNQRLTSAVNTLSSSLILAKTEAIRRNKTISVISVNNDWKTGWDIVLDNNSNGIIDAPQDEVLRRYESIHSNLSLNSDINFLSFSRMGISNSSAEFVICNANSLTESKMLNVSSSGFIELGMDNDKNSIPENTTGLNISSCGSPFY